MDEGRGTDCIVDLKDKKKSNGRQPRPGRGIVHQNACPPDVTVTEATHKLLAAHCDGTDFEPCTFTEIKNTKLFNELAFCIRGTPVPSSWPL